MTPRQRGLTRKSAPSRGLFAGVQLLTLGIAFATYGAPSGLDLVLGIVSIVATAATIVLQHSRWLGSSRPQGDSSTTADPASTS